MNNIKEAVRDREENPEQYVQVNMYLEETFKEYVKEKYFVENPEILVNPAIM